MRRIDPHAHPRPGVFSVVKLAEKWGIGTILFMPKSSEEVLTEKDLKKRLAGIQRRMPAVKCFFYLRLTSDSNQIKEAVRLARNYSEVVGLKLYPPENEQKKIYRALVDLEYFGVLAVHAEKASLFRPGLFDPKKPWTHNLAQPPLAEIMSIEEQIGFAREVNFQGALYICHITLPESAEIIWQAKKHLNIYSEVTPHHLLLSELQMRVENGLLLKVNPPLRSRESVMGLLKAVKRGLVDCVGTDYAPHLLKEKLSPPYLSGIAIYELYGILLGYLREQGMSEEELEKLTYRNIKKVFGDKLREV